VPDSTGAARVLYIDDDPGLGRLVQRALEARGYALDYAPSGDAGLARLAQGGIDVVALDHHMPGQVGLDVLHQIQAMPAPPPVIYVTGSEDSHVAVAAMKAGAVDYVWKDVQGHFKELLAVAVATALEKKKLQQAKDAADQAVLEARDRAELLLKEVNHRVANSLALVAALARMQMNAVTDDAARAALQEMQARILAIASVHRRLYTSTDVQHVELDAYLRSLLADLDTSMNASGGGHRILVEAVPAIVATDRVVSLGVVVTELVTNAHKYAYPPGAAGDIRVRLQRDGGTAALIVEDDGVGWTGAGATLGSGVGTRILKALADGLQATLSFDPNHRGTRAVFSFPLVYEGTALAG
jgi:two-component sensor histidine kinase